MAGSPFLFPGGVALQAPSFNPSTNVLSGTAPANASVILTSDGVVIGTTTANGSGAYSAPSTGALAGSHVFAAFVAGPSISATVRSTPGGGVTNIADHSDTNNAYLVAAIAA